MNLQAIIFVNVIGIIFVCSQLIMHRVTNHEKSYGGTLLNIMVFITVMQCIMEMLAFAVEKKQFAGAGLLALGINGYLYAGTVIISCIWSVYVDYRLFGSRERLKKRYRYGCIPAAAVCAGAVMNLFVPVFFRITEDNTYIRTPLAGFAWAVNYGYLIYSLILVKRNRKKQEKYMFLPVAGLLVPVFAGSVIQLFFSGFSVLWISVAITFCILQSNVQTEEAYIDSLSGLYNRQYVEKNFLHRLEKGKGIIAGVLLDIDNFKFINDNYGHSVGDQAIRDAGSILRKAAGNQYLAARYAGDEFLIFMEAEEEAEIKALMEKVRRLTEEFNQTSSQPYKITFSMGAEIVSGESCRPDIFLDRIDKAMYQDKKAKRGLQLTGTL